MRSYKFILYSILAIILSFMVHEFAHWLMGELLGYEMRMTLNTGYPIEGKYNKDWHYTLISSVGPLITLLQAIIFYFLIKKYSNKYFYPFLFTCFYLELLSGILNFRNPNDLGRISTYFNLGLYTLSILFIATHFSLIYKTSAREHYGWKFNLATILMVILFSSIWIIVNQKFKVILI